VFARQGETWTLVPRDVDANALGQLAPVKGRVRAATSGLASGTSYAVSLSGELSRTVARAEAAVVVGVGAGLGVGVAALIAASARAGLQPDAVLAAVAAGLVGVVLLAVAGIHDGRLDG
jgi:hypothetical protein